MNILGLMSGSSLDGLDLALVKFEWLSKPDKLAWKLLRSKCVTWSEKLLKKLASAPKMNELELIALDLLFCEETANLVQQFQLGNPFTIDQVSSHGHTIYHYPEQKKTLQIGNGKNLASLTGLPVVADFRSQDLILGGQGAPLAPIVEKYLFPGYGLYLNLGGIANLTIANQWTAFDVSPCNQILNYYAQKLGLSYDDKGLIASQGKLNQTLWNALNTWEYYGKKGPKSLDNNQLKNHFIPLIDRFNLLIPDILCTFSNHIAYQIKEAVARELEINTIQPGRMMATGGGVYNAFLLTRIKENLQDLAIELVLPADDIIQCKEAMLMALMGFLKTENLPNCLASATGASRNHTAGTIYVN
jgi:anhydro-N-acetylmuramic acid kinase